MRPSYRATRPPLSTSLSEPSGVPQGQVQWMPQMTKLFYFKLSSLMRLRNFKGETKNLTTRVPNWYVVVLVFSHCYENYHSNPQGKVKGRERQRSQGQAVSIVFHLGPAALSPSSALLGMGPTKNTSPKPPFREQSAGLGGSRAWSSILLL